jgi:hypothetical protein
MRNYASCSVAVSKNVLTSSVHCELYFALERRQQLEDKLYVFMCGDARVQNHICCSVLSLKKLGMNNIEGRVVIV